MLVQSQPKLGDRSIISKTDSHFEVTASPKDDNVKGHGHASNTDWESQ
jgi:hypothetical protein